MNNLKTIITAVLLSSCCFGTDECVHDDELYFRILSSSGEELFTGANPKYTIDQLKLYTVNNGSRLDAVNIFQNPDFLWTSVDHKYEMLIVEFQGQPKDTVNISYQVTNNKCCDEQSHIKTTTVDGNETDYVHSDGIDITIPD